MAAAGTRYQHVVEILSRYDRTGRVAVEIGCGGSPYREGLKARHVGIDLPRVHYAGARPAVLADGRSLPFQSACADLVFMVAMLYHVPEADVVLAECHRVLKHGGTLLIFDYNLATTTRLKKAGAAAQVWSPRELRRRVRAAGFQPSSIWNYDLAPASGWKRTLLQLRIVRYLRHLAQFNEGWNVVVGTKPNGR